MYTITDSVEYVRNLGGIGMSQQQTTIRFVSVMVDESIHLGAKACAYTEVRPQMDLLGWYSQVIQTIFIYRG